MYVYKNMYKYKVSNITFLIQKFNIILLSKNRTIRLNTYKKYHIQSRRFFVSNNIVRQRKF